MALAAPQAIAKLGTTATYATPSATENITWAGALVLHIKNTGGSPGTVTLVDPGSTPSGSVATNPTVSIPATTGDKFIYLPPTLISSATGQFQITFATGTFSGALLYF
jgi:hypothetical protein